MEDDVDIHAQYISIAQESNVLFSLKKKNHNYALVSNALQVPYKRTEK